MHPWIEAAALDLPYRRALSWGGSVGCSLGALSLNLNWGAVAGAITLVTGAAALGVSGYIAQTSKARREAEAETARVRYALEREKLALEREKEEQRIDLERKAAEARKDTDDINSGSLGAQMAVLNQRVEDANAKLHQQRNEAQRRESLYMEQVANLMDQLRMAHEELHAMRDAVHDDVRAGIVTARRVKRVEGKVDANTAKLDEIKGDRESDSGLTAALPGE